MADHSYAECRYDECHYADCRGANCRYAERHWGIWIAPDTCLEISGPKYGIISTTNHFKCVFKHP